MSAERPKESGAESAKRDPGGVGAEAEAEAAVRGFYEAFDGQDLDAFVGWLDPEAELITARGPRYGRDAARAWATRATTGELEQHLVLEQVRVKAGGVAALARYRRQWWWRDSDELAREDEMAAVFELRDGRILRWQPFDNATEALAVLDG